MSRRKMVTEDGKEVLLPGRKMKRCACGQVATRYCDFPKYGSRSGTFNPDTGQITSVGGDRVVLCAEPLCEQCSVEQPNEKDFCRYHDKQVKRMIEDASDFDIEGPGEGCE